MGPLLLLLAQVFFLFRTLTHQMFAHQDLSAPRLSSRAPHVLQVGTPRLLPRLRATFVLRAPQRHQLDRLRL